MRQSGLMVLGCVMATGLIGCSPARQYVRQAPEPASIYVVEIVGAAVTPARPDGQPWDLEPQARSSQLSVTTALGNLTLSLPRVGPPPRTVPGAPDVVVTLTFGGRRIESPPSQDSFDPAWGYRFLVDPLMDAESPVTIQVADEDGDHRESIGSTSMALHDLLASGEKLQLGPFGSVEKLELSVTRQPSEKFAAFETRPISVSASLGGWVNTGVQVYSGMHIAVAAEGRVRLSRMTTGSWGPEGVNDPNLQARWQSHNVEGFEAAPHGALIAAVVDPGTQFITQRLVIGDGILTRLDGTGILLLGVNDTDSSNNAGVFQARVGGGARVPTEAVARPSN